jgi:hypothetical protein
MFVTVSLEFCPLYLQLQTYIYEQRTTDVYLLTWNYKQRTTRIELQTKNYNNRTTNFKGLVRFEPATFKTLKLIIAKKSEQIEIG